MTTVERKRVSWGAMAFISGFCLNVFIAVEYKGWIEWPQALGVGITSAGIFAALDWCVFGKGEDENLTDE